MIQITTMLTNKCTQLIRITIMLYYINSYILQASLALHQRGHSCTKQSLNDFCVHLLVYIVVNIQG
jgi:hypothetical protein